MMFDENNWSVSQSPKKLPTPLAKLSISWAWAQLGSFARCWNSDVGWGTLPCFLAVPLRRQDVIFVFGIMFSYDLP